MHDAQACILTARDEPACMRFESTETFESGVSTNDGGCVLSPETHTAKTRRSLEETD